MQGRKARFDGILPVREYVVHLQEARPMDMPVNAEVQCVDGACGRSTYVVLKPRMDEVTHLVVKEKQAPHIERLVPIDMVEETTADLIRLRCNADELSKMQPFMKVEYVEVDFPPYVGGPYLMEPYGVLGPEQVAVLHESVPAGELAVRRGTRVEATDGQVGRVDEFLVSPKTERITHLVLREGHLWGQRDVTIPVSEIEHIEEDCVYLKLDKQGVEALPAVPIHQARTKP
jgi:sporulation protein YlmC with PRC-barrel domain